MLKVVCSLCCVAFLSLVNAGEKPEAPKPKTFDLQLKDQPLHLVCARLGELAGVNVFCLKEKDRDLKISVDLKKTTSDAVLEYLRSSYSLYAFRPPGTTNIVWLNSAETLSIKFKNASIRDVINIIAIQADINLINGPDVKGEIKNVNVINKPWPEVCKQLAKDHDLVLEFIDVQTIRIVTKKSAARQKKVDSARSAYVGTRYGVEKANPKRLIVSDYAIINKPLGEVLQQLSKSSAIEITPLNKSVAEKNVTIKLGKATYVDVLDYILVRYGYEITQTSKIPNRNIMSKATNVSMVFNRADLRDIINTIAIQAQVNLVLGPEVKGRLSMRLENVPWLQALRLVTGLHGFVAVPEPGNIIRINSVDLITQQAAVLGPVKIRKNQKKTPKLASMVFSRVSLKNVIKVFSIQLGEPIAIDSDVTGEVSCQLSKVTLRDGLGAVLRSLNLEFSLSAKGGLRVSKPKRSKL